MLRGCGDEHLSGSRSRLAHGSKLTYRAAAPARTHVINVRICVGMDNPHEIPVHVGFVREDHGQCGHDPLTNLALGKHERDAVVWSDLQPCV